LGYILDDFFPKSLAKKLGKYSKKQNMTLSYQRVVGAKVSQEMSGPDVAAVGVLVLPLEHLGVVIGHRQLREAVVKGQVDDLGRCRTVKKHEVGLQSDIYLCMKSCTWVCFAFGCKALCP
jgi:hypothetical protein